MGSEERLVLARDSGFRTELVGRHYVALSLAEAGYEIAIPMWDVGIDAIAFRSVPRFVARPLQIKAATGFGFGIFRKYEGLPDLVMVYATRVRERSPIIYAMTHAQAIAIATELGWTTTKSWIEGGWVLDTGGVQAPG